MPKFKSPYFIFLTHSENVSDTSIPAMILRSGIYSGYDISVVRSTNTERYHGGTDNDEMAALISLILGIRVKSGYFNRVFEVEGDPKGQPILIYNEQKPVFVKSSSRPVLPRTVKTHNLEECQIFESFPQ